jgi:uncharacterized protein (TIGR02268 family)
VCASADETTTFVFDSRVAVGAVEFQPVGRLADWALGQEGLSLHVIPKGDYLPGERVKVTVRFADGAAPESASFLLVGHAAKGTRRAYVFRQPRPPDVCEKERDEAQAEARQCQEDKARLLAERQEPGGLMGVAWLEGAGVVASNKIRSQVRERPANALGLEVAWSYSYTPTGESRPASVAVRLGLLNTTASGARRVNGRGQGPARRVRAPAVASGAAGQPGGNHPSDGQPCGDEAVVKVALRPGATARGLHPPLGPRGGNAAHVQR